MSQDSQETSQKQSSTNHLLRGSTPLIVSMLLALATGAHAAEPHKPAVNSTQQPSISHHALTLQFEPQVQAAIGQHLHSDVRLAISRAGSTGLLDVQSNEEQAEQEVLRPAPKPFGTEGTRRWTMQAGGGIDVKDSDNLEGIAGVGLSYFIQDDLSLNLELNGFGTTQDGPDAAGINGNLLFRWHFVSRDTWSLYIDGGGGVLVTSSDVPQHGSSFNFTPQAGLGWSVEVADANRLMLGARWHHISNANTYDNNPGRDSVLLYAGLSMPF